MPWPERAAEGERGRQVVVVDPHERVAEAVHAAVAPVPRACVRADGGGASRGRRGSIDGADARDETVREPGAAARIVAPRQLVLQVGERETPGRRAYVRPTVCMTPWQFESTKPPSRLAARSIAATAGLGSSRAHDEPLELLDVAVA